MTETGPPARQPEVLPQGRVDDPLPESLAAVAPFAGRWVGRGEGSYPTIEPFAYTQEVELRPVPGKPFLAYRSATRHADDGRPLHAESGFLRVLDGGDAVELVVAQGSGVIEAAEGMAAAADMLLTSTTIGGTTSAKEVTTTERRYTVEGDVMSIDFAMAAVGVPLTHHLSARLTRER